MNLVELHMISDSTGETAARLVQALEAQFPDQEFSEIRHPRVESVADLQLAVERMRGRQAVVIYTLVEPELRESMRPRLEQGLDDVGLTPTNRVEVIARKKLVEELLDRVVKRGFFNLSDLRDAISKNN